MYVRVWEKEEGEGRRRRRANLEEGRRRCSFVDKEGREGRVCLRGNKGDFGYLKPKLAIVYSF